jgi:secreted PhoX family phosphatase
MAKPDGFCNRAEAYEAHDNVPLSPAQGDTISSCGATAAAPWCAAARPQARRYSGRRCSLRPRRAPKTRTDNVLGHIIEMTPPDGDHAADRFAWDLLVRYGDPSVASVGALWNPATSDNGWFACPDNAAVDTQGRLCIATDQGRNLAHGGADGLYGLETEGARRQTGKLFFRFPVGAEMCGPCFTPDQETLFVAVQHPGADATDRYKGFKRASTFADPIGPCFLALEKAASACELDSFPVR